MHMLGAQSLIPSHKVTSMIPACIWKQRVATPADSILVCKMEGCFPSGSQTINNVSKTYLRFCCGFRGRLSRLCDSYLVLFQTGQSLWPRNGWVSGSFRVSL